MEFALTEEQRAIKDTVARFVNDKIIPLESRCLERDRKGEPDLPPGELADLRAEARRSGLWGIATPAHYGGAGLGPFSQVLIRMELGRTFVPFSFGGDADNILFQANDEQKREYLVPTISGDRTSCFALTEPGAGSDAGAIRTSARRDGPDWVINGEKTFITRGTTADYAIVFAVTDGGGEAEGITCFLVDRAAGWTSSPIPTMSNWEPAALSFQDVRVPGSSVLGEVGKGFELAMTWIGRGRYMAAARAVGAAERLLEMGIEYSKMRETFGRPLSDRQAIQWMISDSAVEIASARLLTLHAAWLAETGRDARHASSMAKLAAAEMVNRVVDRVLQIHGGMGYSRELPIERWYRELRVLRIFEGTDEIQRRTIARNLLRGHVRVDADMT